MWWVPCCVIPFQRKRVTRLGPYLILGFFFSLLRSRRVRSNKYFPRHSKLFGLALCLFSIWLWCLIALVFDDWITYTQEGSWSFTVGLYQTCVQGSRACHMYISAGILFTLSVGFLFLAFTLLMVSNRIN